MGARIALVCLLFVTLLVLAFSGLALGNTGPRFLAPASQCQGQLRITASRRTAESSMRCLVNYARQRAGVRHLQTDRRLRYAGALRNREIVRCGQFSHSPCGISFNSTFRRSGFFRYGQRAVGENLAWSSGLSSSPRQIMTGWLESGSHRQNLFSPSWRYQGLAVRRTARFQGHPQVTIWANTFGI